MDPGRHYLIVTDHELDQDRLAAKVQQAMAAGPCQFYLFVLAVPPAGSDNFSDLIVLAKRPADEIILAASRQLMARMLAMDLAHRVQRHFGLPVTVLGVGRKTKT